LQQMMLELLSQQVQVQRRQLLLWTSLTCIAFLDVEGFLNYVVMQPPGNLGTKGLHPPIFL